MQRIRLIASALALVLLLVLFGSGAALPAQAEGGYIVPVLKGEAVVSGNITIHWIKVNLDADNTFLWPQGAKNKKPKYNASDPEPRWNDGQDHVVSGLTMYNESGRAPAAKVGFVNTDYFCAAGCIGDVGAPQGLFLRKGVKYQWTGGPHKRSAFLIKKGQRQAYVQVFGTGSSWIDQNNVGTSRHAVSGGPIVLWNGNTTCNPFGEDTPSQHCNSAIARSGICISADGRIVYLLATQDPVTVSAWANFMKNNAYCDDGMDFDGGSSSTMVWRGSTVVDHQRAIGTGLMVMDTNVTLPNLFTKDRNVSTGLRQLFSEFIVDPRPSAQAAVG